jgi:predicted nucleic acid-binding protein
MPGVILDTGPLVAFLNRRDRFHAWATSALADIAPPLITCEAVLSEACFLLRDLRGGSQAVLELVSSGLITVGMHLDEHAAAVRRLMVRYASVPMSLADACLVRLAETAGDVRVLTLDRDFRVYRRHGRQVVPAIMPEHP